MSHGDAGPDDPMALNPVKDRLARGEIALGLTVRLTRSAEIARLARATGHDFLRIDAQHASFNVETIAGIAQSALACGVAALVRVRGVDDPDVGRLLDAGTSGIVFPDVQTAEQAQRAVAAARFPPRGTRSFGGGYPQFDYRSVGSADAMPILDEGTLVVCMVESREGIGNVAEIAAVDGVDVVHVGMNDLLASLGKPGRFDDPELAAALERTVSAASAHGVFVGCGGTPSVEVQADVVRRGVRLLTTRADVDFMLDAASRWVTDLRHELAVDAPRAVPT